VCGRIARFYARSGARPHPLPCSTYIIIKLKYKFDIIHNKKHMQARWLAQPYKLFSWWRGHTVEPHVLQHFSTNEPIYGCHVAPPHSLKSDPTCQVLNGPLVCHLYLPCNHHVLYRLYRPRMSSI
jgi:hypothetical protein